MVENDTSSVEYQLSTSTGPFDIPFYFIENGHIVAELYTQNGDDFNKTTLTVDVDYYLNGAGDKDGGQLTLLSAHSGATLLIYRDPDATQLTSYLATGKFPATSHERALDKLTMLIQKFGWWWDTLALKKPNIFANYYDALNNRIRNLRDPSQAQDATTKNYVDSADNSLQQQIASNFKRSLRVPDSSINQLPSAEERAWKGLGFDGAGQPKLQDPAGTGLWGYVPAIGSFEKGSLLTQRFEVLLWESTDEYWRWDGAMPKIVLPGSTPDTAGGRGKGKWLDVTDATLRSNLGSSEEGLGADLVAANAYHSVREILSRTKTYSDYGKSPPINGYDEVFYASVFADKPGDNDLYLPGKLNIAADLYGTSNNAALLTLLGNNSDSFRAQIVSGNTSVLSGYAMAEDLLIYGGMVGRSAITTNSPTYTANTITITDGADLSKLKTDSVIKTSDLYWGKVVSISGNVITVDGWYKLKVAGIPAGSSAELNRIDKIYFENLVMWAPSTYTGSKVVGAEWDFMIAKDGLTEKNGWDLVLHPSSTYGMDTAYRVRSAAAGIGWNTGLRVEDISYAGLYIGNGDSGVNASLGSIVDASSNAVGVRFQGLNSLYSILWRYNGGTVFPSALTPYGFHMKGGRTSSSAASGTSVSLDYSSYYVNNNTAAFSLILPSTNLVSGQEIEFYIFGTNAVTVTCSSGSVNVNGASSYSFTPTKTYTRAVARWNGSSWYFFA